MCIFQSNSNKPEWAVAVTSLRGILLWELLPCFLKHSKGNALEWLNLIVATTMIIWKNLYDTLYNNGQDNSTFQIRNIRFFFSISLLVFYNCSRLLNPISVRFCHLDFSKIIIICQITFCQALPLQWSEWMILSRTCLRFFMHSCKIIYSKPDMMSLLLGRTSLYGNSYNEQQINFDR